MATRKSTKRLPTGNPIVESFRAFLYVVWKHLNLPDPTPVQYDIADYLQYGGKRILVEGFRGVGKSWITSAFVCWSGLRDPQVKILVISASKQRADDFSTFTQRLIKEIPILQHLSPKQDQRDSKIAFDFGPALPAHAPSVKSAGITGQITGSRAHIIIADDVEVPNNSATEQMREKLLHDVGEFEAIIVPEGESRIVFLGTPQSEMSVYNKLRERGYLCRIWPARFPDAKQLLGYNGALAPTLAAMLEADPLLAGKPTDPRRFGELDLQEREASWGRSSFALQFQLDTTLSDKEKYPLKTCDLMVMDLGADKAPPIIQYGSAREQRIPDLPCIGFAGDFWYKPMWMEQKDWADYEGCVMFIDPSGRGLDETAYSIVAQCHGNLFLLDSWGFRGEGFSEDVLLALARAALKFKVKRILIEENYGGGMFAAILRPVLAKVYPCTVEDIRVGSAQKEKRIIDTLEPILNSHRIVVSADLVKKDTKWMLEDPEHRQRYSLFYQLTRVTKERGSLKQDDRLDSLAGAVNYWLNSLKRDQSLAREQHQERLLDADLRKHMEHCTGAKLQRFSLVGVPHGGRPGAGRPSNWRGGKLF
jgi:hypothetical protein